MWICLGFEIPTITTLSNHELVSYFASGSMELRNQKQLICIQSIPRIQKTLGVENEKKDNFLNSTTNASGLKLAL